MSQIPDDLADAVRRAATVPMAHPADPGEIERRWRRRRRRRMTVAAAGAATVLAAGVAAVPTLAGRGADGPPAAPAAEATTAVAAPAQPLLLGGGGAAISVTAGNAVSELRPDSSIMPHRLPELDGWNRILALPDGRLAALGYDNAGVRLVVVSPTGTAESDRAVTGQPVRLVAATTQVAYLWRPAGLVEHDLAGGRERTVLAAAAVGELPDNLPAHRLDVAAGKLVLGGTPADPCRLRVVDLGSGRPAEFGLAQLGCAAIGMVRVSPDGARVAVSYQRAAEGGQARIAIVGLGRGTVHADVKVGRPPAADAATAPKQPAGMAWQDDDSVRAALVESSDADGGYRPDQIRQETIRAG